MARRRRHRFGLGEAATPAASTPAAPSSKRKKEAAAATGLFLVGGLAALYFYFKNANAQIAAQGGNPPAVATPPGTGSGSAPLAGGPGGTPGSSAGSTPTQQAVAAYNYALSTVPVGSLVSVAPVNSATGTSGGCPAGQVQIDPCGALTGAALTTCRGLGGQALCSSQTSATTGGSNAAAASAALCNSLTGSALTACQQAAGLIPGGVASGAQNLLSQIGV